MKLKNWNMGIMILLAILSFYLASRASLFYENLTYVGNLSDYRSLFIFWGISQSLFYGFLYVQIIHTWNIQNRKMNLLTSIAITMNIISFLLPYQNHSGDLISQTHVYMSVGSSVLTCIVILMLVQKIQPLDFLIFIELRNIIITLATLVGFMAILLGDFTSIMELIFTNGISYLLIQTINKHG